MDITPDNTRYIQIQAADPWSRHQQKYNGTTCNTEPLFPFFLFFALFIFSFFFLIYIYIYTYMTKNPKKDEFDLILNIRYLVINRKSISVT